MEAAMLARVSVVEAARIAALDCRLNQLGRRVSELQNNHVPEPQPPKLTSGGVLKLKLPCPEKVGGISADPEPDWSFADISAEINALEAKISGSALAPFTKERARDFSISKSNGRSGTGTFVMRITDDDDMNCFEDEDEEVQDQSWAGGTRFNVDGLYLSDSDDSGDESALEAQPYLMEKVGLEESALFELSREHQLRVREELRNQMSALETDLKAVSEMSISGRARAEKDSKERREKERKLDTEYRRNVAEAVYSHLDAVQRDLEFQSQIEERKIRSDAAYEDAKRKEKALQEEKVRKERDRAEAEAKRVADAKRAEDAKRAALEAQIRAAKEAQIRAAKEASEREAGSGATREETYRPQIDARSCGKLETDSVKTGKIKATESALKLEQGRLQKLKQFEEENRAFRESSNSNKDFRKHERQVSKLVGQITRAKDIVRQKADDLVSIFNDARVPQSISIEAFAKKVVSHCTNEESDPFACSHVIVQIASKVPHAMDLVLAELNKACIYTVPKHYSQSAFESREAYYKAIGFQEDEGMIETVEKYIARLDSYMKLYGAIVQTEISRVQNPHGLKEGWAWCARFLNTLPANRYTAVALNAFIHMAGYSLFSKYKNQFQKILNCISDEFMKALRERGDLELNPVIADIDAYIKDRKYLHEPNGRSLEGELLASINSDQQPNYYGYAQSGHHY